MPFLSACGGMPGAVSARAASSPVRAGVKVVDPAARTLASYLALLAAQRPGCILLTGIVSNEAVRLADDVHAALPAARISGRPPCARARGRTRELVASRRLSIR